MDIQDLQSFLESPSLEGGFVSVDLLKIARNVTQRQPQYHNRKIRPAGNKLKLVIDAECCLDRLYGGYFSDWACGGQWNRMVQFLSLLIQAIERGNIELAFVFDGTSDKQRMTDWIAEQASVRQKVGMVLKHVTTKGTPPPKVWWAPPTCLKTALRMALRHLNTTVICTMDDHQQEVIGYCREYGCNGLLGDDGAYAAFDPPRYFSSEHIKLTYKGSLETKEYMLSELTKTLQLSTEQVCVVAALLGNFLLQASELQDVYKKMSPKDNKLAGEAGIRAIAEFVRSLPPPSDMDALVAKLFTDEKRSNAFRQSVHYYLNGTANGFLKYCSGNVIKKDSKKKELQNNNVGNNVNAKSQEHNMDISGFASETTEQEQESLEQYKLATSNAVIPTDIIGLGDVNSSKNTAHSNEVSSPSSNTSQFNGHPEYSSGINSNHLGSSSVRSVEAKTNSRVGAASNNSNNISIPVTPKHGSISTSRPQTSSINSVKPSVSTDVLRTASLRHQKGLMAPFILHVLTSQEVKLPCLMEDEHYREFPQIHEIYKLLRQRVYAVLFNLHHIRYVHSKKKEGGELPENTPQPDIIVNEWVYNRSNPYQKPEAVKAEPLPWAVPTLHRLWFGPSVDDKRRRMRALLSCLNSDTPLILNTSYVPQHMLIMACVLRYIMSYSKPILRRQELDAFLCQAYSPDLMNAQYLQELTLNVVSSRGVQLAAVFMEGVEIALLANDACGAPLPWLMCCPWLYFDGKLFHNTLARSTHAKNLLELCENHIDRVVKVERMRKAILEGLDFQFAKMPLPPFSGLLRQGLPPPPCALPTVSLPSTRGPAGLRQRALPARGGQLQIAGVVVGSWGANYGYLRQQPPVTGRGRGYSNASQYQRPNPQRKPGPPTYHVNKKPSNKKKPGTFKQKQQGTRGRGMTLNTNEGEIFVNDYLKGKQGSAEEAVCEDGKNTEHLGQGDGPSSVNSPPN